MVSLMVDVWVGLLLRVVGPVVRVAKCTVFLVVVEAAVEGVEQRQVLRCHPVGVVVLLAVVGFPTSWPFAVLAVVVGDGHFLVDDVVDLVRHHLPVIRAV